jgi:hypothetical protein
MWADPDLTGPLLLIGLYWAERLYLDPERTTISGAETARAVFGDVPAYRVVFGGTEWVLGGAGDLYLAELRKDIRRYCSTADPRNRPLGRTCVAPMVRRDGPCGQPASTTVTAWMRDLDTGERYDLAYCARHRDWAEGQVRSNAAAWKALGGDQPTPPANTGGVLRRHLPEVGWEKLWRRLDEKWEPPPEREPFVRPTLTVLITDDVEPAPPDVARPRLSLVPGVVG